MIHNINMKIAHDIAGVPANEASVLIVWGHGWGKNRHDFDLFAQSLSQRAAHILIDFPGFGESPQPPDNWVTADYADAVADLIKPYRAIKKIIWVGHSFGGRVGMQLAARRPDLVDGIFLIAAAGLPRKRKLSENLKYWGKIYTYKALKKIAVAFGMDLGKLREKFGSADYKVAGKMRPIFLSVIKENLSEQAKQIVCPVYMIYGSDDRETPPDIGERLVKLIKKSQLLIMSGQDHFSLLTSGRPLVIKHLCEFMETL